MFERFTPEARSVVTSAQGHARRLGHGWVGCEHLLLAVTTSGTGLATLLEKAGVTGSAVEEALVALAGSGRSIGDDKVALAALGIDLDRVRSAVEETFGAGALDAVVTRRRRRPRLRRSPRGCAPSPHSLPFTPRAKRCLETALRESLRLHDRHIGPEHLVLALLARDDTMAWAALARLGVDHAVLHRRVEEHTRMA